MALQLAGKTAKVRVYSVKVPSSGIRVAAFQQFVLSLIMNRPAFAMVYQFLEADQMQGKASHKGTLSDLDWKIVCQVEAVMSTARIGVIASQNEHSMLFAYTPMIRKLLMKLLRKGDLRVVDTRSLNNDPNKVAFKREIVRCADLDPVAVESLNRTTVEGELRCCAGIVDGPVIIQPEEIIAMFCDLKTTGTPMKNALQESNIPVSIEAKRFLRKVLEVHREDTPFPPEEEQEQEPVSDRVTEEASIWDDVGACVQMSAVERRAAEDHTLLTVTIPGWMKNWQKLGTKVQSDLAAFVVAKKAAAQAAMQKVPEPEPTVNDMLPPQDDNGDDDSGSDEETPDPALEELGIIPEELEFWAHLEFDAGKHYLAAEGDPLKCGVLPKLARRYIGRLNAESHKERMVSVGSGVVGTKNTCMGSRETRNKVVLRGNYKFMRRVDGGE